MKDLLKESHIFVPETGSWLNAAPFSPLARTPAETQEVRLAVNKNPSYSSELASIFSFV